MKKYLLLFLISLSSMFAFAGSEIKVIEGSAACFKEKTTATVTFDWDDAMWNNEISLAEQLTDKYVTYKKIAEEQVIKALNECSKGLKPSMEGDDAKYDINIKFTNFDKYLFVMGFKPGFKSKVWADVTITEKSTGATICFIKVTELTGDRDLTLDDSWKKCLYLLGTGIISAK